MTAVPPDRLFEALEKIHAGIEDLRRQRDPADHPTLEAAIEGLSAGLARVESKLDTHIGALVERSEVIEHRLSKLERKSDSLEVSYRSQGSRITLVEKAIEKELDQYRREETKVERTRIYGEPPPDE